MHCVKPHPHLYVNAECSMWKWEKSWCGRVAEGLRTAFVCAANIWWTAERYPFGVGTSEINTSTMLGVCVTRQTTFWHLFGFASVPRASFVYRCGQVPFVTQEQGVKNYSVTELHCVTSICNVVLFHTTMQLERYEDVPFSICACNWLLSVTLVRNFPLLRQPNTDNGWNGLILWCYVLMLHCYS